MSPRLHPLVQGGALDDLWRALSDPTRRQILDLLRESPRTTGQLALAFPQSRYAIMKHLDVLVATGLVIVTREGRERWNRINPVPLRELYERWVQPFEALWAGSAIRLKRLAERNSPESRMPKTPRPDHATAGILNVALEIPIAASRDKVWRTMIDEVHQWWPRDFHASTRPSRMHFDARLGGRLYEQDAEGGGVVWYTVIALSPGHSIDLAGHLTTMFGGPSQTLLRLALRDQGARTVLELSDSVVGNIGDRTAASLEEGWRALFDTGLKAFVESA
jgi:DNA-binding transcriptional ArsR family regulator